MKRRDFLALLGVGAIAAVTPLRALEPAAGVDPAARASDVTVLHAGDRFTIEGVYSTTPVTGLSTGLLQHFVVTTTVIADDQDVPCWPVLPLGPIIAKRRIRPLSADFYSRNR